MKQVIILYFVCFSFLSGNSQSTWGNDSVYISFYSKIFARTDAVPINKSDFQIRFWFSNGANKINKVYFLLLANTNNNWNASFYQFTTRPPRKDKREIEKKEITKINLDSLYTRLVSDSLLTLTSDTMNDLLDKKGQHRYMSTDSGPTNYTIQLLTYNSSKVLNYKCPTFFYEEKKIEEFKMPSKIITALLSIIGFKGYC